MKNRPENPNTKKGTPQLENGHIKISNELWEALMCSNFTKRERKIIDVVIRFSYGCRKKFALLQKTDIAYFARIDLSDACKTTTSLIKRQVLKHNPPYIFSLNKHYRAWQGLNTPTEPYFQKIGDVLAKNLLGETPSQLGETPSPAVGKTPSTGRNTQLEVGETPSSTGQNTQLHPTQPSETIKEKVPLKTVKDSIKDIVLPREVQISADERKTLSQLKSVPTYPFDFDKDLSFLRDLMVDFPTIDIIEEVKKWKTWLLDKNLENQKKKVNYRLRLRKWLTNALKYQNKEEDHATHEKPTDEPAPFSDIPPELTAPWPEHLRSPKPDAPRPSGESEIRPGEKVGDPPRRDTTEPKDPETE